MKLSRIEVANFKSYRGRTGIEVAPITVIAGTNGCGKSNLIDGLLTVKQTGKVKKSLKLDGALTSVKKFDDVSWYGESNYVSILNTFEVKKPSDSNKAVLSVIDIFKAYAGLFADRDNINSLTIQHEVTIKKDGRNCENVIKANSLTITTSNNQTCAISMPNPYDENQGCCTINVANLFVKDYSEHANLTVTYELKDGVPVLTSTVPSTWITAKQYLGECISRAFFFIPKLYENIQCVSFSDIAEETAGRNALNCLLDEEDTLVYQPPMPPTDEIYVTFNMLRNVVNSWVCYMGLDKYFSNVRDYSIRKPEAIKDDMYNVRIPKALETVLPILVEGIMMEKGSTMLLRNPENNLHPNAQLALADFIIELEKHGKQVIIETNSEFIVNRLLRRYMEGFYKDDLSDKIKFYFVDMEKENFGRYSSNVKPIEVDCVKGFVDAPVEFFGQFSLETTKIFEAGIEVMKKLRG